MSQQDTWAGKQGIDKHGTWRILLLHHNMGLNSLKRLIMKHH